MGQHAYFVKTTEVIHPDGRRFVLINRMITGKLLGARFYPVEGGELYLTPAQLDFMVKAGLPPPEDESS